MVNNKSKCTLIIDGNWLLMSRLSVLNNKYKNENELCQELKLLMVKSIKLVLRQFNVIDNIIFVTDGGSWRNTIDVPQFLKNENIEYKGNRERDESINWDLVFYEFDMFSNMLKTAGINVSREKYIEGDDWCWYWSNKLNSENTNCIIWSKDKDLTQLVKTNADNCFTIWWNKESGAYVEDKNDEDVNFLFNYNYNENESIYRNIIASAKIITKINPKNIIIDKIIRGDLGDNIIPIIYKQSKTNPNKKFRVSVKDLDSSFDIHNETDIRTYINKLLNLKNYIGKVDKAEQDIIEHFIYNVKLVELNEKNYPDYVKDIFMSKNIESYDISTNINAVEEELIASNNQIKDILNFI
jgi:5'-3' exonuclease